MQMRAEDEEVFLANFIKKPEEFLAQNLCAPGTPSSFFTAPETAARP